MKRRLAPSQKITDAIAKHTGGSVDPNSVAVYEWAALTSLPLKKKGTLFDGGRVTETTMRQMADFVNNGGFVPMHTLHNPSTQGNELPVGRLISAQVVNNDQGVSELRVLLYVLLSETDLVAKLDGGAVEEVSVGLRTKHLNCSECGFDYLGEDSTFENIWGRVCANGHEIGVNGVHTLASELDTFMELSFVSKGASQGAKYVNRAKSLLGEATYNQQLAATGVPPDATCLFASPTPTTKEPSMDLTALVNDLTTAKASIQVKDGELATAKTTIEALNAEVKGLNTQVTELTAKADGSKVPELEASLKTTKETADAAVAFIRTEADRLAVAAGLTKPADDASLEDLTASIETARTKLRETVPVGGKAPGANSETGDVPAAPLAASFKTV